MGPGRRRINLAHPKKSAKAVHYWAAFFAAKGQFWLALFVFSAAPVNFLLAVPASSSVKQGPRCAVFLGMQETF
jgi:hypothetical protein